MLAPFRVGDPSNESAGDIVPGELVLVALVSLGPSGLADFSRSRFLFCAAAPVPRVPGILSNKGYTALALELHVEKLVHTARAILQRFAAMLMFWIDAKLSLPIFASLNIDSDVVSGGLTRT